MSINIIAGYTLAILTSMAIVWFFYKITHDSQSISSTSIQ